ncbi:MAG TPA: carbonic anhydrase [Bryobacteraceae bacterium]|nr:carbonic anhydrase [Bryobacteraceae bacterium]
MRKLVSGYKKFRTEVYPGHEEDFRRLATGQQPLALFITCSDSRIVPDMLMQAGPGELFICRNAGNIVPAHGDQNGGVSATIEYAVRVLKVKHIILCGHSDCGVMHGLLHPDRVAALPNVSNWLTYGARARAVVDAICEGQSDAEKVMELARQNVLAQVDNLKTHPSVAAAIASGGLQLHAWVYQILEGEILAWVQDRNAFVPLDTVPVQDSEPSLVSA